MRTKINLKMRQKMVSMNAPNESKKKKKKMSIKIATLDHFFLGVNDPIV